jgi:8-oxo-dGTP diphosphatase
LCHVINGDKFLLKMATRGVSKGKWNAPGGKIEPAESPLEGAAREVLEETGLKIDNVTAHGALNFHMDGKADLSFVVHLFSTKSFSGEIKSTDEGEVKWFNLNAIPYGEMWDDDNYWLYLMLQGRKFDAEFYYNSDNTKVKTFAVIFKD